MSKLIEYVRYSLDIHKLPDQLEKKIRSYMLQFSENNDVTVKLKELNKVMNPAIYYKVIKQFYSGIMKEFWMFKTSTDVEIMFIVLCMKPQIAICDETIVVQGEPGDRIFIILQGSVSVMIRKRNFEHYCLKEQIKKKKVSNEIQGLKRSGTIRYSNTELSKNKIDAASVPASKRKKTLNRRKSEVLGMAKSNSLMAPPSPLKPEKPTFFIQSQPILN